MYCRVEYYLSRKERMLLSGLFLFSCLVVVSAVAPTPDFWLNFEYGTTLTDLSSNHYSASINCTNSTQTAIEVDSVLGSHVYHSLPGGSAYPFIQTNITSTGNFSVCAWIKLDSNAGADYVLASAWTTAVSPSEGWRVEWETTATPLFTLALSDGSLDQQKATGLSFLTWTHLCITHNTVGQAMVLYVNGTVPGTSSNNVVGTIVANSLITGLPVSFGGVAPYTGVGTQLIGKLDEVQYFLHTLTSVEVTAVYALPLSVATTAPPTTLPPTTLPPTTVAPTTLPPTTAAPTTVAPGNATTVPPTTLPPTTTAPTGNATTAPPTTLAPTTAAPGNATTLPPTTVAPTTLPPTTLPPTTEAPTTAAPTTSAPTNATVAAASSTWWSTTNIAAISASGAVFTGFILVGAYWWFKPAAGTVSTFSNAAVSTIKGKPEKIPLMTDAASEKSQSHSNKGKRGTSRYNV